MTKELVTASSSGQEDSTARPETTGNRLARWASNLLVSGVILIVGLVFGREVIHWWRSGTGSAAVPVVKREAGVAALTSSAASGHLLAFGDFPHTLRRAQLAGELQDVLDHLQGTCRAALAETKALSGEPGPAELRMLEGTTELTPVDGVQGEWSLYELRGPLPIVVGIREATLHARAKVAAPRRRVVSWGMAFPSVTEATEDRTSWTLFTYAIGSAKAQQQAEFSLPAPPFGRKTLSLRTDAKGVMRGFHGRGSASDWMAFYDEWFESHAWHATSSWHTDETATWRRRFEHDTGGTTEFVLAVSDSGSIQAVALQTPLARTETR